MSLNAANAVLTRAVQSLQVSVAAISASKYDAAGAPTVLAIDGTPAANQVTLFRNQFGTVFCVRKDAAGAPLGVPKRLDRASQVFEVLFEGVSTGAGEVGDKDNGGE